MPLFDKFLADENYDKTALVGLCDVSINGQIYKNERIRLDLKQGVVRIEASKFTAYNVPFGKPKIDELTISNVSIYSRGVHLTTHKLGSGPIKFRGSHLY